MTKKIEPEPLDVLSPEEMSAHVKGISAATKKLLTGGLNRRAVVLLIYDSIGTATTEGRTKKVCNKKAIRAVLDAMVQLEERYCQ